MRFLLFEAVLKIRSLFYETQIMKYILLLKPRGEQMNYWDRIQLLLLVGSYGKLLKNSFEDVVAFVGGYFHLIRVVFRILWDGSSNYYQKDHDPLDKI